jgi:hypothetical protein
VTSHAAAMAAAEQKARELASGPFLSCKMVDPISLRDMGRPSTWLSKKYDWFTYTAKNLNFIS